MFHQFAILFPKEKIGVIFFIRKKTNGGRGGGSQGGVWQKTVKNTFFFGTLPLYTYKQCENCNSCRKNPRHHRTPANLHFRIDKRKHVKRVFHTGKIRGIIPHQPVYIKKMDHSVSEVEIFCHISSFICKIYFFVGSCNPEVILLMRVQFQGER